MKFDVIIGNPPYQGEGGTQTGRTIWDKIVDVSLDHVKDGGLMAFIHPGRWRQPEDKLRKLYTENHLVYLSIHSAKDGFKTFKAHTPYDVYMVKKVAPGGRTRIRFIDGSSGTYRAGRWPFIPNSHINFWVPTFATEGPYLEIHQGGTHGPEKKHCQEYQDSEHPYPFIQKMGKTNEVWYSSRPHKHQHEVKIAFRDQGKPHTTITEDGCGSHTYYVLGDDKGVVDFINSDKYKEIAASVTFGHRQIPYKPLNYLPLSVIINEPVL